MVARFLCVVLAAAALVGCYDVPTPACGFACGPVGACPVDYVCNAIDNRCQLEGSTEQCTPVAAGDAGPDSSDDRTPPQVIGLAPSPNATGVPVVGSSISAAFSEGILNLSEQTFVLSQNGITVSGVVTFDASANTAFFHPTVALVPGTLYSATITTAITDASGNPLPAPVTWQFTTQPDTTPPMVTGQSPTVDDVDVGVAASVTATFSEHVVGISTTSFTLTTGSTAVPGHVAYSQFSQRATFTPTSQLLANTVYTATLTGAIMDAAGNLLAGSPVTWSFTTGTDDVGPSVLATMPFINGTGVATTDAITITFDEHVVMANATTITVSAGGTPAPATVSYDAGTHTATLQPTAPLAANTVYTVALGSSITDAAGNPITGITSFMFTTAP